MFTSQWCFTPEILAYAGAILIIISGFPYAIGVWRKEIIPNLTSWVLWSTIGFSVLLNYKSSGAEENVWVAVGAFLDPLFVTAVVVYKLRWKFEKPNLREQICIVVCVGSLLGWWFLRNNSQLIQASLYLGIIADMIASIPTVLSVWIRPNEDRPFAWILFSLGHLIGLFSVTNQTVANYSVPISGLTIGIMILCPIVTHRVRQRITLRQWF